MVKARKVVALLIIAAMSVAAGPRPSPAQVGVGGSVGATSEPFASAVTGAAVGAAGGPIGMVIGAGVGLLYGLWAKRKQEELARAEAERQRAQDRELERQMATQRPGGLGGQDGEGQGVLIVADHLAESPGATTSGRAGDTPTAVASGPPDAAPAQPGKAPTGGASAEPGKPSTAIATTEPGKASTGPVTAEGFRDVYDGDRLVRQERRTQDGKIDVVLHYDPRGRLARRDESTRLDGRLDTSTFYVDGILQRKESDTDADGAPDVWAYYDATGQLARLESLAAGIGRRTEHYRDGRLAERVEGNRRWIFDEGGRVVREGRQGPSDRMLSWRHFGTDGSVARDEEFGEDGRLTAVSHYEAGRLVRRELYEIDETAFTRVPVASVDGAGS